MTAPRIPCTGAHICRPGNQLTHASLPTAAVNDAFKGTKVSVSSLSKDEARKLLQYHALPGGALQVSQLKPGIKATMLAGSNVKVDAGIE